MKKFLVSGLIGLFLASLGMISSADVAAKKGDTTKKSAKKAYVIDKTFLAHYAKKAKKLNEVSTLLVSKKKAKKAYSDNSLLAAKKAKKAYSDNILLARAAKKAAKKLA